MALRKIGAVWRKEKEGRKFFSGTIDLGVNKVNILVMPNNLKETKKGEVIKNPPAYNIFIIDGPKQEKVVTQKVTTTTNTD